MNNIRIKGLEFIGTVSDGGGDCSAIARISITDETGKPFIGRIWVKPNDLRLEQEGEITSIFLQPKHFSQETQIIEVWAEDEPGYEPVRMDFCAYRTGDRFGIQLAEEITAHDEEGRPT